MSDTRQGAARENGLLGALRRLAATAAGLVATRLELLTVELEEERARLVRVAILYAAAGLFLGLGVVTLTVFLILLAGEAHRVLVAGLIAAVYIVLGAYFGFSARAAGETRSKLFSGSLAELRRDRDMLS